jgi:tetratricopeptide (TPR) repeat protein
MKRSEAGLADPADPHRAPGSSSPGHPDLTWYEIADALWLATKLDPELPPAAPAAGPDGPERATEPTDPADRSAVERQPRPEPPPEPAPAPPPAPGRGAPPAAAHPASATPAAEVGHRPTATGEQQRLAIRSVPALPGAPAISRALRPLKQLVPSRHEWELDEPATAERAAEDPLWLPVVRPADERRWDVVVVIDDHVSMAAWRETVTEFVTLLRRQGAFRNVGVRLLDTDAKEGGLRLHGPGGLGLPSSPAELLTAAGRRIVLVMTDGAGPAWHTGDVLPMLQTLAQRLPLAIIQLLPQSQWHRSGIRPRPMRLRAAAPGAANARIAWQVRTPLADPFDDWDQPIGADAVPVPVLQLSARWLAQWVRLVTGDRARWTTLPAVLAAPPPAAAETDESWQPEPPADPRQRVLDFTSWATPTALTLATHLAAAPLNLPVMRIVQRRLLPDSDPSHLSEVLNSGLLRPVTPVEEIDDSERVTFDFDRGVREELLAAGRRADTARVMRLVDEYLGPRVPAVRGLSQVLDDPDAAPQRPVTPDTVPFVQVEQTVLRALSGRYLARSRRLQGALGPGDSPGSLDTPVATTVDDQRPVTIATHSVIEDRPHSASGGAGVTSSTAAEPVTPSVAAPRTPTRAPVVWGNIPPRNPNFTGRKELLTRLHERMQHGTTAVLPEALHGMGGVGKSQLAVEYVYLHQNEYDLVWWIPAERPAQVGAALVELAQRMKLPVGTEANTSVPAVREALRLGRPYANWLLIFDNADSPESVRSYFPTGGPGSIMVTSRNPQWANVARPLEVDVFAREESIALLQRRGPELDRDDANRLAEALGDLPLALEQAAAWRAETGMTANEYLRLFEEKRAELLEVAAPVDYQLPVAAAWNVSLDRLVVSNPAALRLLQVCSFFAAEPIPRTLIASGHSADIHPELNTALRDPMRLNRAIREINRYALARIDHRTNSVQMHRLIQAVLVDRMSEAEREAMRHSAHVLLASSDRNDPITPENWRQYAELYPHLMASEAIYSTDPWVMQLVDNEAMYLYWWGDHGAACDLSQRAYDARRERLGSEAAETLAIGRWLGFMLFIVGRFQEAAEFNAGLLETHQQVMTHDTEELLAAAGAVASDRRVAGDFAGALELDEDLYRRHVRALGEDDPATLNAAHNLAVSLRLVGDLTRARDLDNDVLHRRVRLFGENHAATLDSARGVIIDRRELGEYVSARAEAQDMVDRLQLVVSHHHPQVLRSLRTLSATMRKAGDHQSARDISEEVRAAFVARYSEEHPDTASTSLNLAIDLRQTGELDAAAEIGQQVRDLYSRLLGAEHPHTVAAALNLAVTHRLRGEVEAARHLDEEGVASLTRALGADHPHTLSGAVNLASDLYAQGEFAEAYERDTDTAERLRRVFGEDHPTTLACQGNLAMDLLALGREAEARALHYEVLDRFHRTLGPEHPATIAAADLTLRANCDLDPMPL